MNYCSDERKKNYEINNCLQKNLKLSFNLIYSYWTISDEKLINKIFTPICFNLFSSIFAKEVQRIDLFRSILQVFLHLIYYVLKLITHSYIQSTYEMSILSLSNHLFIQYSVHNDFVEKQIFVNLSIL